MRLVVRTQGNILLVHLAHYAVDCVFAWLVVSIQQAVRIAVKALCCQLLLLSCRHELSAIWSIVCKSSEELSGRTSPLCDGLKEVIADEDDDEATAFPERDRVPGASPIAISFLRRYSARSGLI